MSDKSNNTNDQLTKIGRFSADVQLLLANERTLLSWIRTGLAVQAGGIALAAFYHNSPLPGILIIFLGIVIALIGYHRFRVSDKHIRAGKVPPSDSTAALQIYTITIVVLAIVLLQVTVFSNGV